uniref:Uncharacterized protein n=1 Tax=Rhizophora mucronata TaxID=61149 RepID=A0A2P2LGA5_RHIMU
MPARRSSSSSGSKFPIAFVSTSSNGSSASFSRSSLFEFGNPSLANIPCCSKSLKFDCS